MLEDLEDPLAGRHGLGQPPGVLGEVAHGLEGVLLVGEEDDQRAGREVAAEHEPRAEVQDHGRRDRDEQVHGALELGRQPGALDALLEALLVVPEKESRNDRSRDRAWTICMAPRASEALEAMLPSRRRWSPETLWIFSLIRTVDSQKSGTVTSDSSASCQFSQNSTATMPTRTNRLPSRRCSGDHHVLEQPDVTDHAHGEVTLAGLVVVVQRQAVGGGRGPHARR